jgi:transcriptional regulator with XRE-family HTH domain
MIYLGKTAKYIRETLGISQRQAAEALDISYVHLSHIENNKAFPSPTLLERYRRLWGVDLYVLAWCLHGDLDRLPQPLRKPTEKLAAAWRQQIEASLGKRTAKRS